MRILAAALALLVVAAGCADEPPAPAAKPGQEPIGPDAISETEGAVDGLVTDDSLLPLVDANATLVEPALETLSDADGRFIFRNVPAGTYHLRLSKPGYSTAMLLLDVPAGVIVPITLMLVPAPVDEPYHVTSRVSGQMNCGVAWRVATLSGFDATCSKAEGTPVYSVVDQSNVRVRLLGTNFSATKSIVLETTWTPAQVAATALVVDYRTYYTTAPGGSLPTPSRAVGDARGKAPLRVVVNETRIAEIIKGAALEHCPATGQCSFLARVFPYASTLGSSSAVDASAYLQQRYEHVITEFFGEPHPEDFTAVVPN